MQFAQEHQTTSGEKKDIGSYNFLNHSEFKKKASNNRKYYVKKLVGQRRNQKQFIFKIYIFCTSVSYQICGKPWMTSSETDRKGKMGRNRVVKDDFSVKIQTLRNFVKEPITFLGQLNVVWIQGQVLLDQPYTHVGPCRWTSSNSFKRKGRRGDLLDQKTRPYTYHIATRSKSCSTAIDTEKYQKGFC